MWGIMRQKVGCRCFSASILGHSLQRIEQPLTVLARSFSSGGKDAVESHSEIQRQRVNQQAAAAASSSTSNVKASKKNESSDLKYDILGGAILVVSIVAWAEMAKYHLPPPPR